MGRYGRTLRVKILKSVYLTVVLPSFLILLTSYFTWNLLVRGRILADLARSTEAIAEGIGTDLSAYDALLARLGADQGFARAFPVGQPSHDFSGTVGEIYATMKGRKVKAVVRGLSPEGKSLFSTFGSPSGEEEFLPGWGIYGLMDKEPGKVVGCQRSMRYGKDLATDFSLGIALSDMGGIVGYLIADLAFLGSQELSPDRGEGVTGRFILANKFDRVVAAYYGSPMEPFERFSIEGEGGETRLGGTRYAFARRETGRHGLMVYGLASIDFIHSSFLFGLFSIGVIMVLFSAVFALVLSRSVRRMTRPMHEILTAMGKVSRGDFSARLDVVSGDEFEEIALRLNSLIAEMEFTVQSLVEGTALVKTAEMKQLQAQFNPHFLYNTIDTAKWMMRMGETDKAQAILTNMAKVLRYSIHDKPAESMIAIRRDIEAIKTYLEIHKLSLGDKLSIEYDIDKSILNCRIPKLLIQPLVENAMVHGIQAKGSGRIGISIKGEGEKVLISISDSGAGFSFSPEEMSGIDKAEGDSEAGMGMSLVLRRARLQYGDRFSFDIQSDPLKGTVLSLRIPRESGANDA